MRISRKKRPKQEETKKFRTNWAIEAPEVLVLDSEGGNLGVMTLKDAIALAEEKEMDLIEINPKITPPVTKISDYGQFQYQQEKTLRVKKAHQKMTKIKGVRLSMRIGQGDLDIRKKHTWEFLEAGHKVKIEVIMKGRENQHSHLAKDMLNKFVSEINEKIPVKLDGEIERQGRAMTATIFRA